MSGQVPSGDILTTRKRLADGRLHLILAGELDAESAPVLHAALADAAGLGVAAICVDAEAVTFVDCGGLRPLVAAQLASRERQQTLVLTRLSPPLRRILEITRLDGQLCENAPS